MLLAQDHAVSLQKTRAALDRFDFHAFDIKLDQVFAVGRNLAVVDQIIECNNRHFLAATSGPCDAQGFVLGAGEPRGTARSADRAFHRLETTAVDLGIVLQLGKILRRRSIAMTRCAPNGALETSTDQ